MPDAFVYPRIWKDRTNQRLLQHVFVHGAREIIQVPEENPVAKQVYDGLAANYEKVQKRNYALLFTTLPTRNSFAMRVAMADIQVSPCPPDVVRNSSLLLFKAPQLDRSGDRRPLSQVFRRFPVHRPDQRHRFNI